MYKLIVAFLLCFALMGSNTGMASPRHGKYRISLITCGPGSQEVWQVFGHSAIRVIDSTDSTDLVYNYGTFDGFDKDFEIKFMRGKLLYCLSVYPFDNFLQEYIYEHRSVKEQVLLLDSTEANSVVSFLEWNLYPQNKYYKYDFFFDNCATRIRDIMPATVSKDVKFGKTIKPHIKISYRNIINKYFAVTPWTRLGVNILLGSKIDKPMTNEDIMFLPDYLHTGFDSLTINKRKITAPSHLLLPGNALSIKNTGSVTIILSVFSLLMIVLLSLPQVKKIANIMRAITLAISGLLGCLILVMWFATNHQACQNNFNILWALPTNLIVAFAKPKGKPLYSKIGIGLIAVSFLLHFLNVQQLLVPEMTPILVALAYIHYKNSLTHATANS
ncbi:MAG: DUF4105 domain-containing protein [Chitinophagia bacterium]|nr:DUF4105 domain-containing protein [Chitinophagia bacterium]